MSVFGLEGFSIFELRYTTLVYRLINFLYPPLAILASVQIVGWVRGHSREIFGISACFLIGSGYSVSNLFVCGKERQILIGHGVYNPRDLEIANFIENCMGSNTSISGDQRMNHLLIFKGKRTAVCDGYAYLSGFIEN